MKKLKTSFRRFAVVRNRSVYLLTLLLIVFLSAPARALVISGWWEDGEEYDYYYSYGVEYNKDFGDPWKTVGQWTTHASLNSLPVDVNFSQSHSVTIQAGWDEILVAVLSIQETITIVLPIVKTKTRVF